MVYRFISGRSIMLVVVIFVGVAIGVYLNVITAQPPVAQLKQVEEPAEPPMASNGAPQLMEATAQIRPSPVTISPVPSVEDMIIDYQLQREQSRSAQMALLREVAANPDGAPLVRHEAQARLLELARLAELEVNIAGLLSAEGFVNPIVVAGEHGLTVSLSGRRLTPDEAGKIGNILAKLSGFDLSKIIILERP